MPYKGVELQSLESDNMTEGIPFSRIVGNARLSASGKSLRIHFFEANRYFVINTEAIKEALETSDTIISVIEYAQQEKE